MEIQQLFWKNRYKSALLMKQHEWHLTTITKCLKKEKKNDFKKEVFDWALFILVISVYDYLNVCVSEPTEIRTLYLKHEAEQLLWGQETNKWRAYNGGGRGQGRYAHKKRSLEIHFLKTPPPSFHCTLITSWIIDSQRESLSRSELWRRSRLFVSSCSAWK